MRIPIDRSSDLPIYRQIADRLRKAIRTGSLAPGTRLPPLRVLASDLGVNRITVEAAYGVLEDEGLLEPRVGSGFYVRAQGAPVPIPAPTTDWPRWQSTCRPAWEPDLAWELDGRYRSRHPERLIHLAAGVGDPRFFPVEDFRKTLQAVLRRDGLQALEYGDHGGYLPLRETLARLLGAQGTCVRPENLIITAGSQQALMLVASRLLRAGDRVVVERPTYSGALDLFRSMGIRILEVPMDEEGMRVDRLAALLSRCRPKLIYTIPTFHNPTGLCLSAPRRRQLVALAVQHGIPVLEDDFVGDLRYEGCALPTLKSLDPGGHVIHVGTFSKRLMPGLRVGYLAVEGPVLKTLLQAKRICDLAVSQPIQRALEAFVSIGRYEAHLRRSCRRYHRQRDAMIQAIQAWLPEDVSYRIPKGGLFLWLQLPEGQAAEALFPVALAHGVTFTPGRGFFRDRPEEDRHLRLNFVTQSEALIERGIRRLGQAMAG